ncbi:MAG TPA: carboxypeptidase regulatory-like domain-containing protein [Bacteroidota bacterium]|nr:carboxypeptidase regulatory-like domain-containing protein [Bacteroidota bacterium]
MFLVLGILVLPAESLSGNITGKINYTGPKVSATPIKMNADPKCLSMHSGKDVAPEQVVVNPNNTLRYVFVYVKKGLEGKKFPTPSTKVSIDQLGCMYHPHVFGIMTHQQLEITNSDGTLHNIHALPVNNPQFNIAQPNKGMKFTKSFDKPEVMVKVKCEVHNWMAAYIGVLDHPFFAVSDDKGNFEIKNLPPGEYELEAWQEKFGTKTLKVTVGASDTKTADFTY